MYKIYIGWDGRDAIAYEANCNSLVHYATKQFSIIPLIDWKLRAKGIYYRSYYVDRNGQRFDSKDGKPFSTDFAFTRFLIPLLEDYKDEWILFVDADILWREDVSKLFDLVDDKYAVMCVKHNHIPKEKIKMGGILQTIYARKNWSSVMLINPSRCRALTKYMVNNSDGSYLHKILWIQDELIGEIPIEWNWLEGYSDENINPKIVHFTRGTPDLLINDQLLYEDEFWGFVRPEIRAIYQLGEIENGERSWNKCITESFFGKPNGIHNGSGAAIDGISRWNGNR